MGYMPVGTVYAKIPCPVFRLLVTLFGPLHIVHFELLGPPFFPFIAIINFIHCLVFKSWTPTAGDLRKKPRCEWILPCIADLSSLYGF